MLAAAHVSAGVRRIVCVLLIIASLGQQTIPPAAVDDTSRDMQCYRLISCVQLACVSKVTYRQWPAQGQAGRLGYSIFHFQFSFHNFQWVAPNCQDNLPDEMGESALLLPIRTSWNTPV